MTSLQHGTIAVDFLSGGGELGRLIGAFDWSRTSLGPISTWPGPVRTTIGIMVNSPVPIVTLWGEEGVMIYNDAYAVVAGGRHPGLLGVPVREGWPEAAGFNDRVMKLVLAGGVLSYRDQELTLNRSGTPEKVWLNLDFSPVLDDEGMPIGVFSLVLDTTARILTERELRAEEGRRQAERDRQRRLFEQAPGFIVIMRGPDHVVEFVNDTHRRMFGSKDWIGKTIREAIPSIAGQGLFEALDGVYGSGQTYAVQAAPIRYQPAPESPAELHYLTFMYAPLYDDNGEVSGIFCEGFDVSDAHRAATA